MADFTLYSPKLRRWEGGFVNDPSDPGGATMCGVTLGTYRQVFGESKSIEDLKAITQSEWNYIMKCRYWDKCLADRISSQAVAESIVDWTVNCGTAAIRKVQAILAVSIDGIVGPKTIVAINACNPTYLQEKIRATRIAYYHTIALRNPSLSKFLKGWINRANDF